MTKQTRAQSLNWEYGGAQGSISHAAQTIKNIRSAIKRVGCPAVVDAGLAFEEQKVLAAIAAYARQIDMYYQVEKSLYQRKKGTENETL